MKTLTGRLSVALITFAIGVVAVTMWFLHQRSLIEPLGKPQVAATERFVKATHPDLIYRRIPASQHPEYAHLLAALKGLALSEYAKVYSRNAKTNTFYIGNVSRSDESTEYTFVYWKEDKSIIDIFLPVPMIDGNYNYGYLYTKLRTDLVKDVVPTEKDVGGSSFLVTKQWADAAVNDCKSSGDVFTVNH